MSTPLVVEIPHKLGKEEAIRRLQGGFGRASSQLGNLFKVHEEVWSGDRLSFRLEAMRQMASPIMSTTGRELFSEYPRSPCRTRPTYRTYCTRTGSFSPSWSRTSFSCVWFARSPTICRAGSPGVSFSTRKTSRTMPSRSGMVSSSSLRLPVP